MQPINPFQDEATWAAAELVQIAREAKDITLKERIALLRDICDRGGLVKGSAVTKRVFSANYVITDPSVEGRKLMADISELEKVRRTIDERLKGALPEPPDSDTPGPGAVGDGAS